MLIHHPHHLIRIPVWRALAILSCISVISHSSHLRPGSWLRVSRAKINRVATITECRDILKETGITPVIASHILVYCPLTGNRGCWNWNKCTQLQMFLCALLWFKPLSGAFYSSLWPCPEMGKKCSMRSNRPQLLAFWCRAETETLTDSICLSFVVADVPNLDTNLACQQVCWWLSWGWKFSHKTIAASPDTERQGRGSLKKTSVFG